MISRGEVIVDGGEFLGKPGRGQLSEARGARRRVEVDAGAGHDSTTIRRSTTKTSRPSRRSGARGALYNYASLWVAMSVCIPTYMLASGLIAGGMSWWQAIGTILLGNLIVLVPMLLNAHAGAKYGIPVSGLRARFVRRARRQYSGGAARAGGLRMVRHPDLDRRAGASTPC